MKTVVLVDFSNSSWACWYATGAKDATSEQVPGLLKRAINNFDMKMSYISSFLQIPVARFIFVKDGKSHRHEIYPEYKGNRRQVDFDPRPALEEHAKTQYRAKFLYSECHEADDVIASAVKDNGRNYIIVSGDQDLWQLLKYPWVNVYCDKRKRLVKQSDIESSFGVSDPRHIALVKMFWGDKSDNIPNVAPRLQKHLLPVIKATEGTLKDFWRQAHKMGLPLNVCGTLYKNLAKIQVNEQLVSFKDDFEVVL